MLLYAATITCHLQVFLRREEQGGHTYAEEVSAGSLGDGLRDVRGLYGHWCRRSCFTID